MRVGLSHGDSNTHYSDIDFGIEFDSNYYYRVVEYVNGNANYRTSNAYWNPDSEVFEVRVNSAGKVEYVKNRVVFYTSTVAPRYPLLVDTSFGSTNSKVDNVYWVHRNQADKVVWSSMTSLMDTPLSRYNGWGVLARRGARKGWDQGATSVLTLGNPDKYDGTDIYGLSFKPSQASSAIAVGLAHGNSNGLQNDIDFAWHLLANGTVEVLENGVSQMQATTYAADDLFEVRVNDAGKIEFVQNKAIVHTSTRNPSFPLRADTSFYE